jgi:D-alanyl-D-alanine carboxypeptidase
MRHTRRFLALGAALCAATLTLSSLTLSSPAVAAPAPAPARASDNATALRAAMSATIAAGATGVIARYDDGEEVTALALGKARLTPPRPLTVVDQARVGSITKSMVSTVALQLVAEGRLRLSDTLGHWLPGVVPNADAITIRMLLNHTSGIFNYTEDTDFIAQLLADPHQYVTPQQLIDVANSHPNYFEPGQGWHYSNTGYILIGLILQKATGTPIQSLIYRRVVKPLHLANTYFATTSRFRGPHAHGYYPPSITGDGYLDTSSWTVSWAWSAGAVVSNARDLARFYTALLSGRLLSPALLRQMTTTVDAGQIGAAYGLGIFTLDTPCGRIWGHDGGIPGYVSFAFTNRAGTRSAVVLLPTDADEAIGASILNVLDVTVCGMFDRQLPAVSAKAAPFRLPMTG